MTERCEYCRYWAGAPEFTKQRAAICANGEHQFDDGQRFNIVGGDRIPDSKRNAICRALPPSRVKLGDGTITRGWPITNLADWCGMFSGKTEDVF